MALQYRVASLFAVDGVILTNSPADRAKIKDLPREVRDHHIARGNLIEWDDRQGDEPPAEKLSTAAANEAAGTTRKGGK